MIMKKTIPFPLLLLFSEAGYHILNSKFQIPSTRLPFAAAGQANQRINKSTLTNSKQKQKLFIAN
jgi:hypothetical protein